MKNRRKGKLQKGRKPQGDLPQKEKEKGRVLDREVRNKPPHPNPSHEQERGRVTVVWKKKNPNPVAGSDGPHNGLNSEGKDKNKGAEHTEKAELDKREKAPRGDHPQEKGDKDVEMISDDENGNGRKEGGTEEETKDEKGNEDVEGREDLVEEDGKSKKQEEEDMEVRMRRTKNRRKKRKKKRKKRRKRKKRKKKSYLRTRKTKRKKTEIREFLAGTCRVLVIGAGGLGCELLKDLALSGFGKIDVIDMDTIDVSNLNRQFLFRMSDVGRPKAIVAAERIMKRVRGVEVTPHFCRIEDKEIDFYRDFDIIVLGLDSLEARSYINALVCGFLEYDADGTVDMATIKPMVDGGTEGFKGHARVILPGITPCFNCTLWLFPPQVTYPLCTLAETPRSPAHCIEYVHLIQWGQAILRAKTYNISGITLQLVQGVVKNIIPAIASTNAIIAAACALETLKIATMCSTGMDNYMMYIGTSGLYTHTVSYEKEPDCLVCSPGVPMEVDSSVTLKEFIELLPKDPRFKDKISRPSISHQTSNLYMQAPPVLEEMTRPNLAKPLKELMDCDEKGGVLNINDKTLVGVLRIHVRFVEAMTPAEENDNS
ncbi:hypothetical protein CBR_g30851 [Chara braunii]|uniref:NEDD8-activating enzyme E1 catalytic subunit n=1 Tax=Chara braunii TaxID=69332 RepID=A0A388JXT7_CHABU|nr:hypothetical protein CBR_g30851 [Chara braunii]|eukprot:GBG62533.1 hypothetical protein CBR_g30851 [Chara braunii]